MNLKSGEEEELTWSAGGEAFLFSGSSPFLFARLALWFRRQRRDGWPAKALLRFLCMLLRCPLVLPLFRFVFLAGSRFPCSCSSVFVLLFLGFLVFCLWFCFSSAPVFLPLFVALFPCLSLVSPSILLWFVSVSVVLKPVLVRGKVPFWYGINKKNESLWSIWVGLVSGFVRLSLPNSPTSPCSVVQLGLYRTWWVGNGW